MDEPVGPIAQHLLDQIHAAGEAMQNDRNNGAPIEAALLGAIMAHAGMTATAIRDLENAVTDLRERLQG
jgi:hypothetical protein